MPGRLFALSDPHLSGFLPKPMEVFGDHWIGHWDAIREDWRGRVHEEDVVLLPGDISWAMHLDQAMVDIEQIGRMPGQKVLLRGNHDFWWSSIGRLRDALPPGLFAIQNDAMALGGWRICGSRGWTNLDDAAAEDRKIYQREVQRMQLSLDAARRLGDDPLVVMTHYPPWGESQRPSEMTALFEAYGVREVFYGHLHGASLRYAFSGERGGIGYHCVSCDGLGFRLFELPMDAYTNA